MTLRLLLDSLCFITCECDALRIRLTPPAGEPTSGARRHSVFGRSRAAEQDSAQMFRAQEPSNSPAISRICRGLFGLLRPDQTHNENRREDIVDSAAERPHVILYRSQLEEWASRTLTDDEVNAIAAAIPHSSIPAAIETIANEGIVYGVS
jgi:hypothetical protein